MAAEVQTPSLAELFKAQPNIDDIAPRDSLKYPGWADLVRTERPLKANIQDSLRVIRASPAKLRHVIFYEEFSKCSTALVSEDLGFKWDSMFISLKRDTFSVWSSKEDHDSDLSVRESACFSYTHKTVLLDVASWEAGFEERNVITVFTVDETFMLRFASKREYKEWRDLLARLWECKYTPNEIKSKQLQRVPFCATLASLRLLCVQKHRLLSRILFKFSQPDRLLMGQLDLMRDEHERHNKPLYVELYPFALILYHYDDPAFTPAGYTSKTEPKKYAFLPLRFVRASVPRKTTLSASSSEDGSTLIISTPGQTYRMECRHQNFRDLWISSIEKACEKEGNATIDTVKWRNVEELKSSYVYWKTLDKNLMLTRDDGKVCKLQNPSDYIGRAANNDVVVTSDGRMGKWHCRIEVIDNVPYVRDLGSRNGIKVNGELVGGMAPLKPFDRLTVGSTDFTFDLKDRDCFTLEHALSHEKLFDSNIEALSTEELKQIVRELRPLALSAMTGKSSRKSPKNTPKSSPSKLLTSHSSSRRSSFLATTESSTILSLSFSDTSTSPTRGVAAKKKGYSSSMSDKSSDSSSSDVTKSIKKLKKKLI